MSSSAYILISDDCSTDQDLLNYLETVKAERIITLKNKTRLGIAGNTNRLIQINTIEIKGNKKWSDVKSLHNSLNIIPKRKPKNAPALNEHLNNNKKDINKYLDVTVWIDELGSTSPVEVIVKS